MIDWLTVTIPFRHRPLHAGRITAISPDGSVEWDIPQRTKARGSFEQSTQVRSSGDFDEHGFISHIQFDGNPSKFLQGQNVWGSDDVCLLAVHWFKRIAEEFKLPVTVFDLYRVSRGDFTIGRVDINYTYALPGEIQAQQFLIALGESSGTKYQRAYTNKGSIYFNKRSRRWSSVVYNKHDETKSRRKEQRIFGSPDTINKLRESVKNCIRWEFKFQSMELKDNDIYTGADLEAFTPAKLFNLYMERIRIEGNMRMTNKELHNLPARLRGTYQLWESGCDLRLCLSMATFYRHKKELMAMCGINIDSAPRDPGSNVVSLRRVLEPVPAPVPTWAYNDGLVLHRRAI